MVFLEEQKQLLKTVFPFEFMTCSFQRESVMKKSWSYITSQKTFLFSKQKENISTIYN